MLVAIMGIIASCKTGTYTASGGTSDQAYLTFTSSDRYAGKTVGVTVDNNLRFMAKVVKDKKDKALYKGKTYAIGIGKKHIKVEYNNDVIYEKDIFVSSQDNKTIALP